MRGGRKSFVTIESKSFNFEIVGQYENLLRISEKGRGRRVTILLSQQAAQWLLKAWGRFGKSNSPLGLTSYAWVCLLYTSDAADE